MISGRFTLSGQIDRSCIPHLHRIFPSEKPFHSIPCPNRTQDVRNRSIPFHPVLKPNTPLKPSFRLLSKKKRASLCTHLHRCFAPELRRRLRHEAARREGDHDGLREALQVHRPQPEAPPGAALRGGPRPTARPLLPPPPQEPRLLRLRVARPPRHRRVTHAPRRGGHAHRQVHPRRRLPPHRPRARPPRRPRAPSHLAQARHRALLPFRELGAQVRPRAHHREHQVWRWRRRHVHGGCAARVWDRRQGRAGLQEGRHQRRGGSAPVRRRRVPPQGGGAHVRCGVAAILRKMWLRLLKGVFHTCLHSVCSSSTIMYYAILFLVQGKGDTDSRCMPDLSTFIEQWYSCLVVSVTIN